MSLFAAVILSTLLLAADSDGVEPIGVGPHPLWAAVTVNRSVIDWTPIPIEGIEPMHVFLSFNLMNDSDRTIDPEIKASQLLINGKPFKDWVFYLSNGPQDDRQSALPPGEFLGRTMQMDLLFQKPGIYKILWKGKNFQSREIEFRVVEPATR